MTPEQDRGEYEEKFLATAKLLEDSERRLNDIGHKFEQMKKLVDQYLKDLQFWVNCHGNDYPLRRIEEVNSKLEEIYK